MDTKHSVKVDFTNKTVEVTGEKEFIIKILDRYQQIFIEARKNKKETETESKKKKSGKGSSLKASTKTRELIRGDADGFKGVLERYNNPKVFTDKYLVFMKYLEDNGLETSSENLYTCDLDTEKSSKDPAQVPRDMSSKKKTVFFNEEMKIWKISAQGESRLKEMESKK